ncbi:uncharacterized protein MONOS_18699 [Monocercomonoides exilis]|uniref:uncharacterized protein n=1 Tax=Monocercomonoides exilis TaxID=2049356 RepID=UPI00355AA4D6|nr:hypothetical protein MONOS_18699 [Monocercomonoides exilis]
MQKTTETDNTKKFSKLFSELDHCTDVKQKQIIEEMNGIIDEMDKEEFTSAFTKGFFHETDKMIKDKQLSLENVILMLKHMGYCKEMKKIWNNDFQRCSLSKRIEKMIVDENKKKKGKNEKLLADLCESYLFLNSRFSKELLAIIVRCLLKATLKKEENEETQKEVEIALLALSNIGVFNTVQKEQYLNEIREIIKNHQKYLNLTQLAYQSAWEFFIDRFFKDRNLEDVIENELHFVREVTGRLEELVVCIDWKREKDERGKKDKEVQILTRWLDTIDYFLLSCKLWNEEYIKLVSCLVKTYLSANDKFMEISEKCIFPLRNAAKNRTVKTDDLLKGGSIGLFLEELMQSTMNYGMTNQSLTFCLSISERLKEKTDDEMEEAKRKELKRKVLEMMEEEGYEDVIISFHKIFDFLHRNFWIDISLNISDYFVHL